MRAARGFSDLSQPALAAELGVSVTTLSRMENGKTPIDLSTAYAIADLCKVPRWFMDLGFEGSALTEDPTLAERVEALENRMDSIYELALNRVGVDIGRDPREPGEDSGAGGREGRPD